MTQRTLDDALAEIEASDSGPKIAAFFDFDGTLIYGYSALVFAQDRIMSRKVGLGEALRTARLGIDYVRGTAGYDELIKLAGSTWKGMRRADVEALGERLYRDYISDRVFPEARALVAAHRRKGHTIAITTSATWFQVAPIARALHIDNVVCQHLEIIDDVVTGAMAGASMWGPGKAIAARNFAAEHDVNFDASYFYADGDEDTALMSEIGHPRPTNPGKHLAAVAQESGWPVLRFAPRGTPTPDVIARNVTGMMAAAPIATGAALLGLVKRSHREAVNLTTAAVPDAIFALAAVNVEAHGPQHLDDGPHLVVWQQRSRIDALAVAKVLRRDCTFIVDRDLATDPAIGSVGRLLDLRFERTASDPDPTLAHFIGERLAQGVTVAIGLGDGTTPNENSSVAASIIRIASNAGVAIVPIAVRGTDHLVTRRPPMIRPGTVTVEVLAPIRFSATTRDETVAAAHAVAAILDAANTSADEHPVDVADV